jgi:hypothetical protein
MKYRVIIEDWTRYRVDIEADNEDDAKERVWVLWENDQMDRLGGSIEVVEIEELEDND